MKSSPVVALLLGLSFVPLPALAQFRGPSRPPQEPLPFPPAVVQVLENRCILCHDSVSPSFGRLALNHWVMTPDGRPGFLHVNAQREQAPSHITFQSMLYRITTDDLNAQMPLGGKLSPPELATLAQWLQDQLNTPPPGWDGW